MDTDTTMQCPDCGAWLQLAFGAREPLLPSIDDLPLVDARLDKCPLCNAVLNSKDVQMELLLRIASGDFKTVQCGHCGGEMINEYGHCASCGKDVFTDTQSVKDKKDIN